MLNQINEKQADMGSLPSYRDRWRRKLCIFIIYYPHTHTHIYSLNSLLDANYGTSYKST